MIAFPINRHRVWQFLADAVLITAAWWLAFFLCFSRSVPFYYRHFLSWQVFVVVVVLKLAVFVVFGFYNRWWRYVSTRDTCGAQRAASRPPASSSASCSTPSRRPTRLTCRSGSSPSTT